MLFQNRCFKWIVFTILSITILTLSACSGSDPETILIEGPPPADADGQQEIGWWPMGHHPIIFR